MDDHKHLFYAKNALAKAARIDSTDARRRLRETLGCKSFQWYMDNLEPNMFAPFRDHLRGTGSISLGDARQCLDYVDKKPNPGKAVEIKTCNPKGRGAQQRALRRRMALVTGGMDAPDHRRLELPRLPVLQCRE